MNIFSSGLTVLLLAVAGWYVFLFLREGLANGDKERLKKLSSSCRFRNPANGYEEDLKYAWLWCLLFGPFYFILKGSWAHALIFTVIAIATFLISWLIYPFFAEKIVKKIYLRRGWLLVMEPVASGIQSSG